MPIFNTNESQLLRKIAYEPEVIVKSANCSRQFEFENDLDCWMFATNAINSFYVYRMPIMKIASFSIVTFTMSPDYYFKIDADLQQNLFPDIRVQFNLADLDSPVDNKSFEKLPAGITFNGKVLHAVPRVGFTSQTKLVPVTLYLAQTIVYHMSYGNSFNKIYENITSYEALQNFERGMANRYGSNNIGFDHKLTEHNDFKYENILLKSANDITIPSVLHTTYKPVNKFTYYFFDDFDHSPKSKPVMGRFYDLTSHDQYEAWNIFEDENLYDISRSLRFKGKVQIADRQESFKPFNESSTYVRDNKSKIEFNKNDSSEEIPALSPNPETGYVYDRKQTRETLNQKSQLIKKQGDSHKHISVYTPDNISFAQVRNNNFMNFLKNVTESIYKYELFESHIDAIQLYRKYTFDQTDLRSYYIPINIINVFSRINPHETPVSHTSQFQTIKFPAS
jgi:hypothetical protein